MLEPTDQKICSHHVAINLISNYVTNYQVTQYALILIFIDFPARLWNALPLINL